MNINKKLQDAILATIVEKLDLGETSKIRIESIEVDELNSEIKILLMIETAAEPSAVADGYFGLTGRVRETLGDAWRGYFPIIAPSISPRTHA